MRINLVCDGNYVVPRNPPGSFKYPEIVGPNQACTLYGATPGQDTVDGASYIAAGYSLNVHDLWRRNFVVLVGWFLFYQIAQVLLIEYLNVSPLHIWSVSDGADTVYSGVIWVCGRRNLQEGEPRDQSSEQDTQGTTGNSGKGPRCHRPDKREVVPGPQDLHLGEGQLRGSHTWRHPPSPARRLWVYQAWDFDRFDGCERCWEDDCSRCPCPAKEYWCDYWRFARGWEATWSFLRSRYCIRYVLCYHGHPFCIGD